LQTNQEHKRAGGDADCCRSEAHGWPLAAANTVKRRIWSSHFE
jgi:hypothetical protein